MRFRSPTAFAGRAALSGAAGIRTIPLRCCRSVPPSNPARAGVTISAGNQFSTGPMAERIFTLAVFRLRPPHAAPRPDDVGLPHRTHGRRLAQIMHRRFSGRPVFRYLREPSHDLAGAIFLFSWVPAALLGFDPSRCCSHPRVSGRLRPSDPPAVSPAPRPTRGLMLRGGPAGRSAPTGGSGRRAAGTGRGSWASSHAGDPFRTVRHADVALAPRPCIARCPADTALGFRLSQVFAFVSFGDRFRPLPLVGFAVVTDVMLPATCLRDVPARSIRSFRATWS